MPKTKTLDFTQLSETDFKAYRERCKAALEECLLNCDYINVRSKNHGGPIDGDIGVYLNVNGYKEFLDYPYQINRVCESVLCDFLKEGRVFDGKSGRFRLVSFCDEYSQRSFEAKPVDPAQTAA
jgi:hypothetical protein